MKWRPLAVAFALVASMSVPGEALAQSSVPEPVEEWERDWTVFTMAPNGAWGVATDMWIIGGLARATSDCKTMSGGALGCGAHYTAIRAGWTLGIRCGDKNIIVSEMNLEDAEFSADWREYEFRKLYYPDLPACIRVVTVDPNGSIVAPDAVYSDFMFSLQ